MRDVLGRNRPKDYAKLFLLVAVDTLNRLRDARSPKDLVRFAISSCGNAVGLAKVGLRVSGSRNQPSGA